MHGNKITEKYKQGFEGSWIFYCNYLNQFKIEIYIRLAKKWKAAKEKTRKP